MAPYDSANDGSVDVFFWHDEYGFTNRELMLL